VQSDAFLPQSNTMLGATNAVAGTNSTQPLTFPGVAPAAMMPAGVYTPPPNILFTNLSTSVIWVSFTISARVAAIPAAGNTTVEVPVLPGTSQTFRCPWAQGSSGAEGSPGGANQALAPGSTTINCNTICAAGTSQAFSVTFGEGV
jgi:hypothetical protein